jgi:hypothetical protein
MPLVLAFFHPFFFSSSRQFPARAYKYIQHLQGEQKRFWETEIGAVGKRAQNNFVTSFDPDHPDDLRRNLENDETARIDRAKSDLTNGLQRAFEGEILKLC